MLRRTRVVRVSLAGLLLALGLAACGGSSAIIGGSDDDAAPASAPATGNAVVQGTVVGAAEGLQVEAVGASSFATVDEEGQFALFGVPAGTVTLSFQGGSIDARLSLEGVVEGQVTSVTVAVSGSEAHLQGTQTCSPTADTFFTGVIESVSGTRLVVAGRQVETSQIKKVWKGSKRISLDELVVGDKVKVWGALGADGVVLAEEIALICATGGDGSSWTTFSGAIVSVRTFRDISRSCTYPYLVVSTSTGNISVSTDGGTAFKYADGTSYDGAILKAGDRVYVEGWKTPGGSVSATLVRL